MKGQDCKLPIKEDQNFSKKEKITSKLDAFKVPLVLINAAFLLLTIILLITVFLPANRITELRQEIDNLKSAVEILQKKIDSQDDKNNEKSLTDLLKAATLAPSDLDEYYDYDDPVDYSEYEYDDYEKSLLNQLTGEEFTKDAKKATVPPRVKRNIVGYTQDGIAIISESDVEMRHRRKMKNHSHHHHHHPSTPSPPSSYSHPHMTIQEEVDQTTETPTSTNSRRHSKVFYKSGKFHNSGDNPDAEFVVVGGEGGRRRHRQRRLEFDDRFIKTGRMRPLPTAHFHGSTSNYTLGTHDNFFGNGHLKHTQKTYIDWSQSSWFRDLAMDRHFSLSNGALTMKESGLYFIYAQIYYYDEHDINGFLVYKNNNDILLQCTTMTHSVQNVTKGNTCFTAAAEYLNENDQIHLEDLSQGRGSIFEPGKSFFGVIKLGDVKI
ncbi:hypothetical protein MTP99_019056 [Tenebrio molitor]|jgi:hypothetical protein|uniref:protein eiger n=1 Tax=Tenebrio molitor TaxID=7067 RepID=UPI0027093F86|nr:hypothetical protein MTP99_019056 [Tenebrio molitor]